MQGMTNVEVQKTGTESNLSLLRRFTKRVQGSGVLNRVRGIRYNERTLSPYRKKVSALKMLERRNERVRLEKLGKAPAPKKRGRR